MENLLATKILLPLQSQKQTNKNAGSITFCLVQSIIQENKGTLYSVHKISFEKIRPFYRQTTYLEECISFYEVSFRLIIMNSSQDDAQSQVQQKR